jgi:hypothetical protein
VARVARLAGALLAETDGRHYLVGDLKEPCDFGKAGFASPREIDEIDARARRYVALEALGPVHLKPPVLKVPLEGEALAQLLADRLVIERNGSVSERLWRLVMHEHDGRDLVDARWLAEVPRAVWQVVRDAVLKCS